MRMIFADTEFFPVDGALPRPICVVTAERGRPIRKRWLWKQSALEPMKWEPGDVLVCYSATAELSVLAALGWPFPPAVLDLYVEFRNLTNGAVHESGSDLLAALRYFKQPSRDAEQKARMQTVCKEGVDAEIMAKQDQILDYCADDTTCMFGLFDAMVPSINMGQALARGEYMMSVAKMEAAGVPVDEARYNHIVANRQEIREHIAYVANRWHPLWDGTTFCMEKFQRWLYRRGLEKAWPRTPFGRLSTEEQTFEEMIHAHPDLPHIFEIKSTLTRIQSIKLQVGPDGRARTSLGPFRTVTGRNQPHRNAQFVFAAPRWMRSVVKPGPGMALANLDWAQQEFGIVGALSGDDAMKEAYLSEDADPYMAFARIIGAVPPDATAKSHPVERELYKRCVLAVQYCQMAPSLARRLGRIEADARALLRDHREAFTKYWEWLNRASTHAAGRGQVNTRFGWLLTTSATSNPRTIRNFGGQANGAEMMRLACVLGHDCGIKILAPVHDSLLIEAAVHEIDDAVGEMQRAMAQASREVLNGFELRSEAHVTKYPDRFRDPKGGWDVWEMVSRLLGVQP